MNKKEITSLEDLDKFTLAFIPLLENNPLIYLKGDLGTGKTAFVKSLLRNLGYNELVTSPTFSLVNYYDLKDYKIYHCDFYRLESEHEILNLAIEEFVANNIVIIEWPDLFDEINNFDRIEINISLLDKKRYIEVTSSNQCKLKLINTIYQGN
jgi:tRNA threonylcarbamoyladenosine biosynthesis protein TsaE